LKIHLLRNETWTFCGKRWQPGAFTHYFKEATCKTCLRSAHYWRNRDEVAQQALSGPVGINVARLLGIKLLECPSLA